MNSYLKRYFFAIILLLFASQMVDAQPYLLGFNSRDEIMELVNSSDFRANELYKRVLRDADKVLYEPNPTVMDKGMMPPSGDKHDYISMARYWWPNPNTADGLPYIRKDGEANPELKQFDRDRLGNFASMLRTLSYGYILSENPDYARKIVSMLKTWFINKKSLMNPNATYAQMVPGRYNGLGRPEGVLDTYSLLAAVDAAVIVEREGYLSKKDATALRQWFSEYVDWMMTSDSGRGEFEAENNHGVAYDVQLAVFAHYAGREDVAREIVEGFPARRLMTQVMEDGSQPRELARTTAFGYSTFNLTHFLDMCAVARQLGVDLYDSADSAIDRAIAFLTPYLGNQSKFPYKQIKDWSKVENNLAEQLLRASRLKENSDYRALYNKYRSTQEQKRASFILFNE